PTQREREVARPVQVPHAQNPSSMGGSQAVAIGAEAHCGCEKPARRKDERLGERSIQVPYSYHRLCGDYFADGPARQAPAVGTESHGSHGSLGGAVQSERLGIRPVQLPHQDLVATADGQVAAVRAEGLASEGRDGIVVPTVWTHGVASSPAN